MIQPDTIVAGDCVELLTSGQAPPADLIFADPPFNIGYKYDLYQDRKGHDEYRDWTRAWMAACLAALKPSGTFWVAIGDEYAAEIRLIGRDLGLYLRNWVIWHYTFGQSTKKKFARSHAHLFYWVRDPKSFTFNDLAVRQPSARQTTYADKRANPVGKLPDDVWSFSRVCGTFNERVKWHPCQMPERVLERIILATSHPGGLVLDPFSGSGTTCVAAARLGRRYVGIDLSQEYVKRSRERIAQTLAGRWGRTDISENPAALRGAKLGRRVEADAAQPVRRGRRRKARAPTRTDGLLPLVMP
jgi:site-specific DNA-methyltransferase (adenine-specific)